MQSFILIIGNKYYSNVVTKSGGFLKDCKYENMGTEPSYVCFCSFSTFYYCPRYSKTVAFPFSHGFFLKESYSLFKETNTRTGEENKNDIFLLNRFYFNKKKLRYSQNVLLFQNRKLTIKIFPRQNLLNYQRSLIYQRTFLNEYPVTLKCYIVPDVLEKAI